MKHYILILTSALMSTQAFADSIYLKLDEGLTPLQKSCITSLEVIASTEKPDDIIAAAGGAGAGDVNPHHTRTFAADVATIRGLLNGVYKLEFPEDVTPLHSLTLNIKVTYPPCDAYVEGSANLMAMLSQADINEAIDSFSRKVLVWEPLGADDIAPAETCLRGEDITEEEMAVLAGIIPLGIV